VIVTLEDSSSHAMGGWTVALSTADSSVKFSPSSAPTDSSGHATFKATSYSSTPESVNAAISAGSATFTLNSLGTIQFGSLGTPSAPTAQPSCTNPGVPTAFNSEAIPSSSGNSGTIEIQLLDCNNNFAPVNDTLTLSINNSDPGVLVNGSSPSVTMSAQSGHATFNIKSQNSVTDTFTVRDTTHSFNVTDPHNHSPSLTFSGGGSSNPTPSPTPTATP
jgi:hypothetical protein